MTYSCRYARRIGAIIFFLTFSHSIYAHLEPTGRIGKLTHKIEHDPKNVALHLKRGRYYLEKEKYAEARDDFKQAIVIEKTFMAPYYYLAVAELALKQNQPALENAELFIEGLPSDNRAALARGYTLKGDALVKQLRWLEAVAAYQKSLEYSDNPGPSQYISVANTYLKSSIKREKKIPAAIDILQQGVAKIGPLSSLQDKLVEISEESGRWTLAHRYLDEMIEQGKRLPVLYYRKARIYKKSGDKIAARETLDNALRLYFDMAERKQHSRFGKKLKSDIDGLYARLI